MIAEILATGDEIRSGALVDSNSAYISDRLETIGISVSRHHCVGDDRDALKMVLQEIRQRADLCIVTGGLGPTVDDVTADSAAAAADVDLVLDPTALADIEAVFRRIGRPMGASNRKQALLPRGAEKLHNPVGTAPGFSMLLGKCRLFFLPGVPPEMKKMLEEKVIPAIESLQGEDRSYCRVSTFTTFGLPESTVNDRIAGITDIFPELTPGLRAKFPVIQIKLYARDPDPVKMEERLKRAGEWVVERMGEHLISRRGEEMEEVVGDLLRRKGATLAIAESCTGGLVAHLLTNVAGSSDYFTFSAVTYANEMKTSVLGVTEETLQKYGAVHEETVKQMAEGARRMADTTYGLATSGIAGPDGGSEEKPVGTICIGLATPDGVQGRRFFAPFHNRRSTKLRFAAMALDALRRELMGFG